MIDDIRESVESKVTSLRKFPISVTGRNTFIRHNTPESPLQVLKELEECTELLERVMRHGITVNEMVKK